jgi:hypothetical protein
MAIKKISTTVNTGDIVTINGNKVTIGTFKNGHITLCYKISNTSVITQTVSTKQLNKLLNNNLKTT